MELQRHAEVQPQVKGSVLAIALLTRVRRVTRSILQSRKWQMLGMISWYRCTALLAAANNWTCGLQLADIPPPQSATQGLHPAARDVSHYTFPIPLRVGGWVNRQTETKMVDTNQGTFQTRSVVEATPHDEQTLLLVKLFSQALDLFIQTQHFLDLFWTFTTNAPVISLYISIHINTVQATDVTT